MFNFLKELTHFVKILLFKVLQITTISMSLMPDRSSLSTNEPTIVMEITSLTSKILSKIASFIFFFNF